MKTYQYIISVGTFYSIFGIIKSWQQLKSEISPSVQPSSPSRPLPPVHINSSWIANQWIPPLGYKLYRSQEIQDYFRSHSILFIGDSTARRNYATLYAILNSTENPADIPVHDIDHTDVIDVNKHGRPIEDCSKEGFQLCRKMPIHTSNQYDLFSASCISNLVNMTENHSLPLWSKWVHEYTLIIFMIGPWEMNQDPSCRTLQNFREGRKNSTDLLFDKLFQANDNLISSGNNITFLWRTWGSPGTNHESRSTDKSLWNRARAHNDYVKILVDNDDISRKSAGKMMGSVSYLDWGHAMLPRLYPEKVRIAGDIDPHYGLEARLAFLQMLINHLVERDRQKLLKINPWLPMNPKGIDSYDDPEQFMIISPQEKIILERARASFCNDCMFNRSPWISCGQRVNYLQDKKLNSDFKSILGVMKQPVCNTSTIESTQDRVEFEIAQMSLCRECSWWTGRISCGEEFVKRNKKGKKSDFENLLIVMKHPACNNSNIERKHTHLVSEMRLSFCQNCTFQEGTFCKDEHAFLKKNYQMSELESLVAVMLNQTCNTSAVEDGIM